MYSSRYAILIITVLGLITSVLFQSGCEKSDGDNQPIVSPERQLHKGWHDSMSGKILFTSYYSDGNGTVTRDHLFVIDKEETKEILLPDTLYHLDGGIEWSPDGSRITFSNHNNGLFIMNSDGTNIVNLLDKLGCKSPSWSPDGALIACIVWWRQIIVIDIVTGYYRDFHFGDNGHVYSLDWSPTGTQIVIVNGIVDATTSILDVSDSTITETLDDYTIEPVWSPNGLSIAYAQHTAGWFNRIIYTVNKDGSDITRVCNFEDLGLDVVCYDLAWSPDGKLIAVSSSTGIYIVDMAGTVITKIETDGDCDNLDWQ